jgi:hypothetical protein
MSETDRLRDVIDGLADRTAALSGCFAGRCRSLPKCVSALLSGIRKAAESVGKFIEYQHDSLVFVLRFVL